MDSPLLSRAQNFAESSNPPKQHRTVLFSNTKLYVGGTPEVYHSLGELSTTTGKGEVEGANTQHDPGVYILCAAVQNCIRTCII